MLSRDFMIVPLPGHELAQHEYQTVTDFRKQVLEVEHGWERQGGVYVPASGKGRRWIGIDPEPHSS